MGGLSGKKAKSAINAVYLIPAFPHSTGSCENNVLLGSGVDSYTIPIQVGNTTLLMFYSITSKSNEQK